MITVRIASTPSTLSAILIEPAMKRTGIILLFIGSLLLSCSPSSTKKRQSGETDFSIRKALSESDSTIYKSDNLAILKLSQHCYLHTSYLNTNDFGRVPCNGMLVVSGNEAVVFDTPADNASSEELIRFVSGVLKSSIKGVIATHFHEDCIGGLEAFNANRIPSYASAKTIALLKEEGTKHLELMRAFNDSLEWQIGGKRVQARFFGEGHTKDNIIGYYGEDKVLFGGCLIKEVGAGKGNLADANVDAWSVRSVE
jgi:metallo-beta-lactamase class B